MKALFLSSDTSIPDVASATRLRMQAYAEAIGEVHVLVRSSKTATIEDGSIFIHELACSKALVPFRMAREACRIMKAYEIGIVSAQDPFEHGWAALRAVRRLPGAKLHVQVHTDFLSPWFREGYSRLALLNHIRLHIADRILPRADGIRVVSPRIERSLLARYESRIVNPVVIPIAASEQESTPKDLVAPFPFTLLAVSRLSPEKRIGDVLRAVALARSEYDGVGLVIAGDGPEKSTLRHLARSLGIEDYVRFLGQRADVSELMKAAHAFVQASAYEGYGLSLIEAARANLPIITTDVGVIGDILMPNTHALVAHVGDIVALSAYIRSLVRDSGMRTALSIAAHQAAHEHLEEFADQPERIADDLKRTLASERA